ncbi:MAG: glycosyltransferase family 39 protein [archaeon]
MAEKRGSDDFNIRSGGKFLKKHWPWIVVVLFFILALYIRTYHMDYPVVGYHNMKEMHYLGEARNFARDGFFEHGFFIPEWDYPPMGWSPSSGAHPDSFPTVSIIVGLFFKAFGYSLAMARLIVILFSSALVFVMYLLMKRLFKREDIALVTAFLTAINPLFGFFGRQVQMINIALFFSMLGFLYYIMWREEQDKTHYFYLFAVFFTLGFLTKYDHFLVIFPVLITFPYKTFFAKVDLKKNLKKYLPSLLIFILSPLWLWYSRVIGKELGRAIIPVPIDPTVLSMGSAWWEPVKAYMRDNYTFTLLAFAVVGIALAIFLYRKNFGSKMMVYLVISLVPWVLVAASYLKGHSYHQYPMAPVVIMLGAFCFIVIADTLKSLSKRFGNLIKIAAIVALLLLVYFPSMEAKDRQFDTQFPGLDVAGEYVFQHKLPGERAMHSGHQATAFLWYADMKGIKRIPKTLDEFHQAEDTLNGTWLFVYNWDFAKLTQDPEMWNHVKENYELRQVGFQASKDGNVQLVYLLFRIGGTFNETDVNTLLAKQPFTTQYEFTFGKVPFYYVNADE